VERKRQVAWLHAAGDGQQKQAGERQGVGEGAASVGPHEGAELGAEAEAIRDISPSERDPAPFFIGFTVQPVRPTLFPLMGNLKKKRRLKMNKHKRRKRLKSHRHKKRTWQK
jgi:hypothetical protein